MSLVAKTRMIPTGRLFDRSIYKGIHQFVNTLVLLPPLITQPIQITRHAMNRIFIPLGLGLLLAATSCDSGSITFTDHSIIIDDQPPVEGSGVQGSEDRNVAGFSSIEMNGAYEVSITCGATTALNIQGDDNLLSNVTTETRDGTLHIAATSSMALDLPLKLTISTPNLIDVSAEGAHSITVRGLSNDRLSIELHGATQMNIGGTTEELRAELHGVCNLSARELTAANVWIEVHGTGNANVTATEKLEATVNGIGKIDYYGDPENVTPEVNGLGVIRKR